jgi:hypothetical protein
LQLEEEDAEACKGERKLVVGTVGVAEERVATLASVRRDQSFCTRWLLLLLRVEAARNGGCCYCWGHGGGNEKEFRRGGRERERWCSHHVRLLGV